MASEVPKFKGENGENQKTSEDLGTMHSASGFAQERRDAARELCQSCVAEAGPSKSPWNFVLQRVGL